MSIPHRGEFTMSLEGAVTERLAQPSAPQEPILSKEQDFSHVFMIQISPAANATSLSANFTINRLISEELKGAGMVTLVSLSVSYMATGKDQKITCAIANSASNYSELQLQHLMTGHSHVSTAYNYGVRNTVELIIPDTLSRQIQPISALLPSLSMWVHADAQISLAIHLRVKVHGPIFQAKEMVFPI